MANITATGTSGGPNYVQAEEEVVFTQNAPLDDDWQHFLSL